MPVIDFSSFFFAFVRWNGLMKKCGAFGALVKGEYGTLFGWVEIDDSELLASIVEMNTRCTVG